MSGPIQVVVGLGAMFDDSTRPQAVVKATLRAMAEPVVTGHDGHSPALYTLTARETVNMLADELGILHENAAQIVAGALAFGEMVAELARPAGGGSR